MGHVPAVSAQQVSARRRKSVGTATAELGKIVQAVLQTVAVVLAVATGLAVPQRPVVPAPMTAALVQRLAVIRSATRRAGRPAQHAKQTAGNARRRAEMAPAERRRRARLAHQIAALALNAEMVRVSNRNRARLVRRIVEPALATACQRLVYVHYRQN